MKNRNCEQLKSRLQFLKRTKKEKHRIEKNEHLFNKPLKSYQLGFSLRNVLFLFETGRHLSLHGTDMLDALPRAEMYKFMTASTNPMKRYFIIYVLFFYFLFLNFT